MQEDYSRWVCVCVSVCLFIFQALAHSERMLALYLVTYMDLLKCNRKCLHLADIESTVLLCEGECSSNVIEALTGHQHCYGQLWICILER